MTTRASAVRYGDRKFQRLVTDIEPRCWRCNRVLAIRLSRPWEMRCRRCKAANVREVGVSLQQGPDGRL